MKEFKGTPGPWVIGGNEGNKLSVNSDPYFVALVDEGNSQEANARLIASAPELLSALQHLVEVYDREDGKQWTTASKKAAIAEARAAIDKALGE